MAGLFLIYATERGRGRGVPGGRGRGSGSGDLVEDVVDGVVLGDEAGIGEERGGARGGFSGGRGGDRGGRGGGRGFGGRTRRGRRLGFKRKAVGVSEDHNSDVSVHKITYSATDFVLSLPNCVLVQASERV
jgi:hypothetical protein